VIIIADQPIATVKMMNGTNNFGETKITGTINQNNLAVTEDANQ